MLRQKNVPGITTIHDSLGDVDSGPRDIGPVINIGDLIDGATVHTHSQLELGMSLESLTDLQRTLRRLFRTSKKKERHSISRGQANQLPACLSQAEAFSTSYDLVELLQQLNLLVDQQFRITNNVD